MKPTTLLAFSPFLLAAVGPLACAAPEDEVESSEDELRRLESREIVGNIAYGTSAMEVQHPGETGSRRQYVALRFEGARGDEIEATAIVGNAADPVLYLLGESFQTLASNDDVAPGQKTSVIRQKLAKSGTYYLAMRTKEGWQTKFYVSLAKQGQPARTWKDALAGQDRWGAVFRDVLPPPSYAAPRRPVACWIDVPRSKIICHADSYEYEHLSATTSISAAGTFDVAVGGERENGQEIKGSVGADGKVTLTRFRRTECFRTSSVFCYTHETDGTNLPATVSAVELCKTKDMFFQSGGYALGSYIACSECQGQCEGGR